MKETVTAPPLSLTLHWENETIVRIDLHWSTKEHEAPAFTEAGKALQSALEAYVRGEAIAWPKLPLALDRMTEFKRRVLIALADIPRGQTLTYGELAARVGSPDAARAVGNCMAGNPFPVVIPCHRVLAVGGPGGYGGGLEMKRYLLGLEGVEI